MADARFEDAGFSDAPLRLKIEDTDDLTIVSALVQDAVGLTGEITWMPKRRRVVILLNRFRWEDKDDAKRAGRPFERVRVAVTFDSVLSIKANGLNPSEKDTIYSILGLNWTPEDDAAGTKQLPCNSKPYAKVPHPEGCTPKPRYDAAAFAKLTHTRSLSSTLATISVKLEFISS